MKKNLKNPTFLFYKESCNKNQSLYFFILFYEVNISSKSVQINPKAYIKLQSQCFTDINGIGWADNSHMSVVPPGNWSSVIASTGDNRFSPVLEITVHIHQSRQTPRVYNTCTKLGYLCLTRSLCILFFSLKCGLF